MTILLNFETPAPNKKGMGRGLGVVRVFACLPLARGSSHICYLLACLGRGALREDWIFPSCLLNLLDPKAV